MDFAENDKNSDRTREQVYDFEVLLKISILQIYNLYIITIIASAFFGSSSLQHGILIFYHCIRNLGSLSETILVIGIINYMASLIIIIKV